MRIKILINFFVLVFIGSLNSLYPYAYLPDDVPLNKALLIVSHNAAMAKKYGWIYYQQLGKMEDQWKAGSRGAKVPIMWAQKRFPIKKSPRIALCHEPNPRNNCNLTQLQRGGVPARDAESFFKEFAQLLEKNKQDVAVLILEDYLDDTSKKSGTSKYTNEEINKRLDEIIEKSGLKKYALKLPPECYPRGNKPTKDWPTVGTMRKTGKRLIIFTYNANRAKNLPYLNYSKAIFTKTKWEINILDEIKSNRCLLEKYIPGANAFVVEHKDINSIPKGAKAKILNIVKKIVPKAREIFETDYHVVNSKKMIRKRVEQCEKVCNYPPSLITMDMVEIGNGYAAVKEINAKRFGKLK
ncbi:hypothetical protein E3J79_00470 [Candidatus Dependentiae bacterium]|nr:MAG: hypothetical protein E3J79_00470 [Candidatus Dependentiae bacterium]